MIRRLAFIRHAVSALVVIVGTATPSSKPPLTPSRVFFFLLFPKWGSAASSCLVGNFDTLCSDSHSRQHETGLRGWFGVRCTVIRWDCSGVRRRKRRRSIMFSRTFHYSLLGFFLALFLLGHTLMLYPLTIGALSVLFHKHRVGNILGIRNLNLPLFSCLLTPHMLHICIGHL